MSSHDSPILTVGALPDNVAADILTAVAKGRCDFLVAASMTDRMSIWMRFLAPAAWNQHLIKVHEKNIKLAAERAANDICIDDGLKELGLDEDTHAESKDIGDVDSVELMKLSSVSNDSADSDLVIVGSPSNDLDFGVTHEESRGDNEETDADSVESVGSQLVRLAAGH